MLVSSTRLKVVVVFSPSGVLVGLQIRKIFMKRHEINRNFLFVYVVVRANDPRVESVKFV